MKCSPLNARLIGATMPSVLAALRRRYPTVCNDMLLDAASAAVERCITSSFSHEDRSAGEMFRWLATATVRELLREFRTARRYVAYETQADTVEGIPDSHCADAGAARYVLRSWLVRRFGPAIAETVWLHSIEGCPPRDIAAIQRISLESIKARIKRTRKAIRRHVAVLE